MKYETASELGVELGPDASARQNGRVGGSMTKKLVTKESKITKLNPLVMSGFSY